MHRRSLLALAASGIATTITGCLGTVGGSRSDDSTSGDPRSDSTTTPDGGPTTGESGSVSATTGGRTDGRNEDPTDGTRIPLTVEVTNAAETARTVGVRVDHVEMPECWYATPECGMPSRHELSFDRSFDLDPGAHTTVGGHTERTDHFVDRYDVVATTGDARRELGGLEVGAESTMGEALDRADYDFRVRDAVYRIRVRVGGDGLSVAVEEAQQADRRS